MSEGFCKSFACTIWPKKAAWGRQKISSSFCKRISERKKNKANQNKLAGFILAPLLSVLSNPLAQAK
jgi:hypothetical protein